MFLEKCLCFVNKRNSFGKQELILSLPQLSLPRLQGLYSHMEEDFFKRIYMKKLFLIGWNWLNEKTLSKL